MNDLLFPDAGTSRRSFFKYAGGGLAALALVASGCDDATPTPPVAGAVTLDFSNDFGVLNYAYALEQLEAAFYARVVASPYGGMSGEEMQILTDLRDHEKAHADFFRVAIPALGGTAIGALTPNFSAVDFTSRASVLGTARTFEDLGVAAYNGAGQYLTNPDLLTIAGKIVSVEARHAAAIRSILSPSDPRAFAGDDVVDPATGLDRAYTPGQVLTAAAPFISNMVQATNVPS